MKLPEAPLYYLLFNLLADTFLKTNAIKARIGNMEKPARVS